MGGFLLLLRGLGLLILLVNANKSDQGTGQIPSVFQVINPEGEIHKVDTSDPKSTFYGDAWARTLMANQEGEFISGYVARRLISREGRFSGYSADIDGVTAFLHVSKAAWFFYPEHDAIGKRIALKICSVYTNGPKLGNLIVNAYAPLKHIIKAQGPHDHLSGATS